MSDDINVNDCRSQSQKKKLLATIVLSKETAIELSKKKNQEFEEVSRTIVERIKFERFGICE